MQGTWPTGRGVRFFACLIALLAADCKRERPGSQSTPAGVTRSTPAPRRGRSRPPPRQASPVRATSGASASRRLAVVRAALAAVDAAAGKKLSSLLAPGIVTRHQGQPVLRGVAAHRAALARFRRRHPDARVTWEAPPVVKGPTVVGMVRVEATHLTKVGGLAPSGRRWKMSVRVVARTEGDRISKLALAGPAPHEALRDQVTGQRRKEARFRRGDRDEARDKGVRANLAKEPKLEETKIRPLGWTRDGRFFTYLAVSQIGHACCGAYVNCFPRLVTAVDARTGERRRYLGDIGGNYPELCRQHYRRLPGMGAFESWLRHHPLLPPISRRTATGSGARARIDLRVPHLHGGWKEGVYKYSPDDVQKEKGGVLAVRVERAHRRSAPVRIPIEVTGAMAIGAGTVRVLWSPDHRRVAWVWARHWAQMTDVSEARVYIQPAGGPRISLVANRGIVRATVPKVATALEAAGLAPTKAGPAHEQRKRSVIYTRKGFEKAARRAAAAIPGGAAVVPLTWRPPFDLVVALGSDAARR